MLHTKSQGHWPFGSREDDIFRVLTIYGHGGHLGLPSGSGGEDFKKVFFTIYGHGSHFGNVTKIFVKISANLS